MKCPQCSERMIKTIKSNLDIDWNCPSCDLSFEVKPA